MAGSARVECEKGYQMVHYELHVPDVGYIFVIYSRIHIVLLRFQYFVAIIPYYEYI